MFYRSETGLTDESLLYAIKASIRNKNPKKVLIIPPAFTRMYSGAGKITAMYSALLQDRAEIDVLPWESSI